MTEIEIGDKVLYNLKFEAVVRFIGQTDSVKGIFYGIELTTPDGRSDGTMNGVSYFKCKENFGIFARRSQLCMILKSAVASDQPLVDANEAKLITASKENEFKKTNIRKSIIESGKRQSGIPSFNQFHERVKLCGNSTAQIDIKEDESKADVKPTNPRTSNDPRRNTIALKTTNTNNQSSNIHTLFKETRRQTIISQQPVIRNATEPECQSEQCSNMKTVSGSNRNKKLSNEPEKENQPAGTITLKYSRRNTFASEAVSHENLYTTKPKFEIRKTNAFIVGEKDREIRDLKEKIETLKILKKKDKDQCVNLESINKELRKELSDVQESKEKIAKEFDDYRNLMTTIEEEFELVTIDKEMAEEKFNEINLECQKLKEQYDEVVKENDILKNNEACSETKKFFDQIADLNKYKNAVQELYQANHSLDEINKSKDAELEILRELQVFQEAELEQLKTKSEKYERDLKEMKDLVDSTADVEVILEKLTFDNENLEEQLNKQNERLMELDRLEDHNLEVIENKNKEIRTLLEECDSINKLFIELQNSFDKLCYENIELNTLNLQLNEKNKRLTMQIKESQIEIDRKNEIIERAKESNRRFSIIHYATQKAVQDDIKRDIDDKLMKIDLDQKNLKIKLITQYLPVNFSRLGGEYDIINLVLLMTRFMNKISLILDYISAKRRSRQQGVAIDEKPENISIQYKVEFFLLIWSGLLKQLQVNIENCSPEVIHSIVNDQNELMKHELSLDLLIDLMKKQCLDHNRNLSNIIQSIKYFQQICDNKFGSKPADCNLKMNEFIMILNKGSECLVNDLVWITNMVGNMTINKQLKDFLDKMKTISSNSYSKMKSALIFLRQNQKIIFDIVLSKSMDKLVMDMIEIVEPISDFGLKLYDENLVPDEAFDGIIEIFLKFHTSSSQISLGEIISKMNAIDQLSGDIVEKFKSGEYDTYKTIVQSASTIDSNAANFREKWSGLLSLPMEIRLKDERLASLNVELQEKSKNLSDIIAQVDYYKKKYEDGVKSRDLEIKQLNNRIIKLEKPEKRTENEKMPELESEILQLRNDIKRISNDKNTLCDSTSVANRILSPNLDNIEECLSEIRSLHVIINYLNTSLSKSKADKCQKTLQKLKPFKIHKSLSNNQINNQIQKAEILQREILCNISTIKIPDLSSRTDIKTFSNRNIKLSTLKSKAENLIEETQKSYPRKNDYFRSLHVSKTNNSEIGRIRFDSGLTQQGSGKCAVMDYWSLKKMEELFC